MFIFSLLKIDDMRLLHYNFLVLMLFSLLIGHAGAQEFTPVEKQLILEGDTSAMLRVYKITIQHELEVLLSESTDINPLDPLLPLLSKRMFLAMRDTANPGVGIAGPQVGINRNVFWLQRFDKPGSPFEFLINPVILKSSVLTRRGGEGCLSIPDERGTVLRSYALLVEYYTLDGIKHTDMLEDFTAVIFQHEYDHLRGILFTDRILNQQNELALPLPQGMELLLRPTEK